MSGEDIANIVMGVIFGVPLLVLSWFGVFMMIRLLWEEYK